MPQRVEKGINIEKTQSYTLIRLREIEQDLAFGGLQAYIGTLKPTKARNANAAQLCGILSFYRLYKHI